ncbi:class II histocompatibility antigen, B-L beta chain-like [Centroberyx affinis]|uniref:class II histocompatibility antigen, B-L beta chain-like n=1 Tax=Centroberyx affinis TaxID=166261 RepID=UPI003A5BF8C5
MLLKSTFLLVLLCCVLPWLSVDGYMFQAMTDCEHSKEDLSDMVYLVQLVFNQQLLCCYDSRLKKYTGYGELGIRNAERFNQDKRKMEVRSAEVETLCKFNTRLYNRTTVRKVPPSVSVKAPVQARFGTRTTVECRVTGFYPQDIRVTWLKDGSEVTEGVSSTDTLANGDWSYQLTSYLELVPRHGETLSCRVEHSSLEEVLDVPWDASALAARVYKKAVGLSFFFVGVAVAAAGVLYYYWKTQRGFTSLFPRWSQISSAER